MLNVVQVILNQLSCCESIQNIPSASINALPFFLTNIRKWVLRVSDGAAIDFRSYFFLFAFLLCQLIELYKVEKKNIMYSRAPHAPWLHCLIWHINMTWYKWKKPFNFDVTKHSIFATRLEKKKTFIRISHVHLIDPTMEWGTCQNVLLSDPIQYLTCSNAYSDFGLFVFPCASHRERDGYVRTSLGSKSSHPNQNWFPMKVDMH